MAHTRKRRRQNEFARGGRTGSGFLASPRDDGEVRSIWLVGHPSFNILAPALMAQRP
jgi:hypothetical protein